MPGETFPTGRLCGTQGGNAVKVQDLSDTYAPGAQAAFVVQVGSVRAAWALDLTALRVWMMMSMTQT